MEVAKAGQAISVNARDQTHRRQHSQYSQHLQPG